MYRLLGIDVVTTFIQRHTRMCATSQVSAFVHGDQREIAQL